MRPRTIHPRKRRLQNASKLEAIRRGLKGTTAKREMGLKSKSGQRISAKCVSRRQVVFVAPNVFKSHTPRCCTRLEMVGFCESRAGRLKGVPRRRVATG